MDLISLGNNPGQFSEYLIKHIYILRNILNDVSLSFSIFTNRNTAGNRVYEAEAYLSKTKVYMDCRTEV